MNKRLLQIRKHFDLTQAEFAEKLKITHSAYSKIELGQRNLTDRTIADICREFNINEDWLRNGTGEMSSPPKDVDTILTTELAMILKSEDDFVKECTLLAIDILRRMDDEQRQWLKSRLKKMVESFSET